MSDLLQFATDAEVALVAERFESCTFGNAEFDHARHLTVLVWYLAQVSEQEALSAMRRGLLKFSAHHGVPRLYHETITTFWVRMVSHLRRAQGGHTPLHILANEAVRLFGDKNLVFAYYSRERLLSPEARATWVEPDLCPLPASSMQGRSPLPDQDSFPQRSVAGG